MYHLTACEFTLFPISIWTHLFLTLLTLKFEQVPLLLGDEMENSVDLDQTAHERAFDLSLQCLLWPVQIYRVKYICMTNKS